ASLIGFPPGFAVTSFTNNQSFFSPGMEIFMRWEETGVFSSISYEGEFGSGYMSNEVLAKVGLFF
ncbi:MAG: hypothetical protein KGJ02_06090, partial [Verrucomicrobiota bacterium]|nr:hypothetical protein [Verrucomicrobiota bacterium]